MLERNEESLQEYCCLLNTLLDSFKIFLRNFKLLLSIFALTTLPLSLLIVSISLYSRSIQSEIYHLESLARHTFTLFEARHVRKESREDAVSLLRFKGLFFIPCYAFSLLAGITSVHSTSLAWHGKRPSFSTAVTAVKETWRRPFVTSIFVYGILLAYAALLRTLAAILIRSTVTRLLVAVVGTAFEVHLMAVLSVALVVSVAEDRFGLEAVRIGSDLMKGRKRHGWVLSVLIILVSGCIGWELDGLMDGRDLLGPSYWPTSAVVMAVIGYGYKAGLVCLFGLVVLWSYVVTTVFYCECKKWHVFRCETEIVTV